ncbi:SPRY domain-containing SOCS box protein 3-like [Lampris incognitus]|uniref:SPRY domain-containing SOCS box protein 3-like n=1 Tax=Lampris incognitus TaxID=2546036 RepID=UPI0024B4E765|nr:SPRY domain-containing SOCS box protein 3-like [Lampris incognitus]
MSHCKTVHKKTAARGAMLRRCRSVSDVHLEWGEVWQDAGAEEDAETDAMAMLLHSEESEGNWFEISPFDPEADYLPQSLAVPETVDRPRMTPMMGESFCQCNPPDEPGPKALTQGLEPANDCLCGEEDQRFDWVWDEKCKSAGALLSSDDREVNFHQDYSCGTAAIRGTKELTDGQHFWEIKMTSPVYGTDMMVGIGTSEVNLDIFKHTFSSLLGHDEDSWGLSYTGLLHHKGKKENFSCRFGQGSIIGLHLDTWNGTLTIYKNRRRVGVAATKLQNKKLYPMICSTAAKSSMKVTRACYSPTSLQYLCCAWLGRRLLQCPDIPGALNLPPGLCSWLHAHMGWVLNLNSYPADSQQPAASLPGESNTPYSRSPSPASTLSACASPSPVPGECPCPLSSQAEVCIHQQPPMPPSSDCDTCYSEDEDYQSKRCRWI